MIDLRVRSRTPAEELQEKVGKILTDDDYNLLLTRAATVRKPDGKLLCIYRPQALGTDLLEASYPTLHELKKLVTTNRGKASGMRRQQRSPGTRSYTTKPIASAIIGAFDAYGAKQYCRLTAFSQEEGDKYAGLFPLFQEIGRHFEADVPDRFQNQMRYVAETPPEWVIPGTPFTTITVNNSYPTGVHTDSGDLDDGFSCLAVLRRGDLQGGRLVFPEYRLAVDMQHGDLLMMDAHEYHGNTAMEVGEDAERISIVAYYRTRMAKCGSAQEENDKRLKYAEGKNRPREDDGG